ncbi:hypothetical protein K432DRAFT_322312 [Lepidopterella palustris CBS 459.81]|uniref:Alpha-1,3-mannosyltransferase n=1 Tax=Lepidopterella palustris CBS 459.81 TaxID=1314670 RepID=A0A8E2EGD4_9PEZI|nr:hypothetical protein K432DRAFT_322312 [Lepidopterella palustris CBS 459.81]
MPPALHPRSRMTTSLFTTTLFISFLVVGTPHILPCPVNPRLLADSADPDALSTRPKRRRRKCQADENGNPIPATVKANTTDEASDVEGIFSSEERRKRRECPVPKPGGLVGQILGFKKEDGGGMPPVIKVEPIRRRRVERKEEE